LAKIRSKPISFSKEFKEDYEFVCNLKNEGINASQWICEAIREKRLREQSDKDELNVIKKRLEQIEKQIKNSQIVYRDKPIRQKIEMEDDCEEDLMNLAMNFEM